MIRKFALALAAVAAIGVAGLASATDASAKPVGWHGGGVHIGVGFGPHYGYGWRHRHWAPRVGFYAPVYGPGYDCWRVRTKRGTRVVCSY